MNSLKTIKQTRDIAIVVKVFFFHFASITHNALYLLSDIAGANSSDNMQLPLESQKLLCYFFFTYAVVLLKTCVNTLICKVGGVTLEWIVFRNALISFPDES